MSTPTNFLCKLSFITKKRERESKWHFTRISSLPNLDLIKSAREATLAASATSTWWNNTKWDKPESLSVSNAWRPLSSFLAVSTTLIPAEANCLTISNPIPLFAPVTTAYLINSTPTPNAKGTQKNVRFEFSNIIAIWNLLKKKKQTPLCSFLHLLFQLWTVICILLQTCYVF